MLDMKSSVDLLVLVYLVFLFMRPGSTDSGSLDTLPLS